MLYQEKELPNDLGRPLNYDNFTNKKQNVCCLEALLFRVFCIELSLHPGLRNPREQLPEKNYGWQKKLEEYFLKILRKRKEGTQNADFVP